MRRWLGLALLSLCASAALAQDTYTQNKSDASVEKNGGTAVSLSSGSLATDALWNAAGDIVYATGDNAGAILAKGTATQLLHSGAAPSWAAVTLTTDVTGLLPFANIANGSALSLFGRSANSSGVQASITCTAAGFGVFRESGSTIGCGAIDVSTAAITGKLPYANMVDSAGLSVTGKSGSGSGAHADITASTLNTYLGYTGSTLSFSNPINNLQILHWEEEFCGPFRGAEQKAGSGATGSTTSGTVAHPCVRTISVGAATGVDAYQAVGAGVATPAVMFDSGGVITGDFIYNINSIGDGTDVVKYVIGFCDKTATGTECSNGFYLYYDRSVSTTDWEFTFANGGSRTRVSCGAVGVGAYHHAQFVSDAGGTTATVSIDGVACSGGSPASNFPANTNGFTAMVKADKTAGSTTTFTMDMDYMGFVINLTTAR